MQENKQKALRYNNNKLKWSLVDFESLKPMVQVLMFGAVKYAPNNWKNIMDRDEILESTMRHLVELLRGAEIDKESGLPHIGHIMCNAMFYSYHFTDISDKRFEEMYSNMIEKYKLQKDFEDAINIHHNLEKMKQATETDLTNG